MNNTQNDLAVGCPPLTAGLGGWIDINDRRPEGMCHVDERKMK
jgi:hypothetical protein